MKTTQRKFQVFFIYETPKKNRYSKVFYIGAKTAKQALTRARTYIGIANVVDVQLGSN